MSKEERISDLERQVENLIRHVERLERQGGYISDVPPVALAPLRSPRIFTSSPWRGSSVVHTGGES